MIATVSLLALGFAMAAQAGPRMYQGSLIIHAFANDTTDGVTTPFTTNAVVAFPPADALCNTWYFHAKETFIFQTYYGDATRTETIPSYGGQVAYHHPNSETTPAGCGDATLLAGNPLTGQGTIHTTGQTSTSRATTNPRGFTIVASEIYGTGSASFPYVFPYLFTKVYANLRNQRGVFCENCGPGRYSSSPSFTFDTSGGEASMRITPGAHKFGGTMKLLGTMYSNKGGASIYGTYVAKYTWLFDYIGAGAGANGSKITAPAFGQDYNYYWRRDGFNSFTVTVQAQALSWTTGTATAAAGCGYGCAFTTVLARAGFDNRNPKGYGDIQMVSPMLTRWIFAANSYYTAGIGIMHIRVAPEPHEWMLLGAGLSMLGLLYRANRRSR